MDCTSTNRTLNKKMESYLENSEKTTREYDLLDLAEDINVFSLAEYAWDEEGYSMFVLLDARRGK